ncbi:kinase-like protein [Cutaneotrichosporon oleaginosum]|uniref:Kinase-like protein n=1 Tax=Cutaneotrichosporon oleaginosum TaxID=879819 RepID=A0A0J1B5S9_9TREE|nr:kinase-like protein [Cutaneotrichosporon oleaginosum]KLT43064.1 kinase-like protein [Cutaneotrichosporon oleaginosum]TXT09996.1 hypothetical protein COLE_03930 [Cutaneotrichosporon oleaginosum]
MIPPNDNAALGLSFGSGGRDAGPSTTPSSPERRLVSENMPAVTNAKQELHSGDGHKAGAGVLAHPAIPPPPSPRRHRSGGLSRMRAASGGIASSKSFGDLIHGLTMTSAPQPMDTAPASDAPPSSWRSASDGSRLADDQIENHEGGDYDNSARFYHRMHSSSRAASPTRTGSASPGGRSASGGASPLIMRRNLTLPPGSQGHSPGANLSTSLSPNSRFLQQHLPPTFPLSNSPQPSPDAADAADPLALPMPQSAFTNAQVILTPTTREWRELKEIGRLEGEAVPDTDSDSASPTSPGSGKKPATGNDYFSNARRDMPDTPVTPGRPVFQPVITAASPIPPGDKGPEGGDGAGEVPAVVLQDMDGNSINEDEAISMDASLGFSSFGRSDSLRIKTRPNSKTPKEKTKRELQREQLFKMVDQEIAEAEPEPEPGHRTWNIRGVGSGGGLDSRMSRDGSSMSDAGAIEPEKKWEEPPVELGSLKATPTKAERSPQSMSERSPSRSPEAARTLAAISSPKDSAARPRPSPLQATSVAGATQSGSDGSLGSDIDSAPKKVEPALQSPPPETQVERYEAIRHYARQLSTRKSLGSGPSRPPSRAPSRRGSCEAEATTPRSPRRRDTLRVSLVAGRVVKPAEFPGLSPLTPSNPAGVMSAKSTLQSFSPFRRASPTGVRPPLSTQGSSFSVGGSFSGAGSYASSILAPSQPPTPANESAQNGIGGNGIDDYIILKEAGQGAYGLVMRAKVKGAKGEPIGDEVIIKYIIKSRILADCWKKHKALGPIPVEIHVMDLIRHLIYLPPTKPHPWDPFRTRRDANSNGGGVLGHSTPDQVADSAAVSRSSTPASQVNTTSRYISSEIKHAPERGHPNVCKLLDFFEDREFYYLVMPRYGTGVDLFDYVESHPDGLHPFEVRSFVGQLTDAVRFLHTNGIVHRDIKDENVILDGEGRCQLIDFGSAAHWRPGKRWDTFSGTLHYASPEILRGEMYGGKEQDVWALGTVAYVLLVGETPFSELPDEVFTGLVPGSRAEMALVARCGSPDEGREPDGGGSLRDAADFVRQCLQPEVSDRPTAEQLLLHRYLAGGAGWVGHRGWDRKASPAPITVVA